MRVETVLFTILFLCSVSANPEDLETLYEAPSGVKCIKCSPGTYLLRHCTENNTIAKCKLCDNGTYTSDYNTAEYCAKCTPHCENLQLVPVQHCTHTLNLTCGCPDGTHNLYPHLPLSHAVCQEDGKCRPGYGSKSTGAPTKNKTCERCKLGQTYSSTSSYVDTCQPCTQCEESDVMSECGLTHDRKCDQNNPDGPISSQGLGTWEIIGIVIGTVMAVVVGVIVVVVCCYRRKSKKTNGQYNGARSEQNLTGTSNSPEQHACLSEQNFSITSI